MLALPWLSLLLLGDLIQEHDVGDADPLFVSLLQNDVGAWDGRQGALRASDSDDFSYLRTLRVKTC